MVKQTELLSLDKDIENFDKQTVVGTDQVLRQGLKQIQSQLFESWDSSGDKLPDEDCVSSQLRVNTACNGGPEGDAINRAYKALKGTKSAKFQASPGTPIKSQGKALK